MCFKVLDILDGDDMTPLYLSQAAAHPSCPTSRIQSIARQLILAGMPTRPLLLLGASSSVGQALLVELIGRGGWSPLVVFVRRPLAAEWHERARERGVRIDERVLGSMDPEILERATREVVAGLRAGAGRAQGEQEQDQGQGMVAMCTLGIGAGTTWISLASHRAIDVDLPAAFARGLLPPAPSSASASAFSPSAPPHPHPHLLLLTAAGASPTASPLGPGAPGLPRYLRVKGEAEAACALPGLHLSVFRPATILGSPNTPAWFGSVMRYVDGWMGEGSRARSITTREIARAMMGVAEGGGAEAEGGVYHHAEMMRAGRSLV